METKMIKSIVPSTLKVVTVEDSTLMASRLHGLLCEMNNVSFLGNASNISQALKLIHLEKPNVVILDIHLEADMPHANGINLLITLRKKYPGLVIIMFTNMVEAQYRNTCIAFGANYFFDKSVDFDRMSEMISKIVLPEDKVIAGKRIAVRAK